MGVSGLLERMRRNPVGDWTIADVIAVSRSHGTYCEPPRGSGSHYKRPIEPVYIRKLVALIAAARSLS